MLNNIIPFFYRNNLPKYISRNLSFELETKNNCHFYGQK
jgi:hypothetical protein